MTAALTAPIDALHAACEQARAAIRRDIDRALEHARTWTPQPERKP